MNNEKDVELQETPTKESEKKPMGDIKFMTAGDFMNLNPINTDDEYIDPGQDCQV